MITAVLDSGNRCTFVKSHTHFVFFLTYEVFRYLQKITFIMSDQPQNALLLKMKKNDLSILAFDTFAVYDYMLI